MDRKNGARRIFLESDSSSVAVRATSAALSGEMFEPVDVNLPLQISSKIVRLLGRKPIVKLVSRFSRRIGLPPSEALNVNSGTAASWVVKHYDTLGKVKVMLIGAPSGGAAHLSAMLGAPFLTQHFLSCFSHPHVPSDDVKANVEFGLEVAQNISKNNDDLEVIIHYDPVHDRLLSGSVSTIRVKLKKLPKDYCDFISRCLDPEGAIVFLNVGYSWLQYVVEENIHVQVGGLGGIEDEEYLKGSERLDAWLASSGSSWRGGWALDDYQLKMMPESEWGTFPGLKDEVKEFAEENGYEYIEIVAEHPERMSELSADLFTRFLSGGRDIWFFDCFTSLNPTFNLSTSIIPVWLPFNCSDSYEFARRFLEKNKRAFRPGSRIYFTLTPNFVDTPDQVPITNWVSLFEGFGYANLIAVDEKLFPVDITHFIEFGKQLRKLLRKLYLPVNRRLTLEELKEKL
ncbi:MAG: hypothetical protein QW506_06260 [Thermoproteota archaeon]